MALAVALLIPPTNSPRPEIILVGRSNNLGRGLAVLLAARHALAHDRVHGVGGAPEDADGVARVAVARLHLARLFVLGHLEARRDPPVAADAGRQADRLALDLALGDFAPAVGAALVVALPYVSEYLMYMYVCIYRMDQPSSAGKSTSGEDQGSRRPRQPRRRSLAGMYWNRCRCPGV